MSLLGRFNKYRFDYASLVFDSVRAFISDEYRTGARMVAIPLLMFMICPPAVTLLIGLQPFGNAYVFAAVLIMWPWILEKPAWSLRQWRADPVGGFGDGSSPRFDWFIHIVFCLVAVACILAIGFVGHNLADLGPNGNEVLGLAWAVALAGSTDLARSMVALFLARLNGFPLYGPASRKD